MARVKRRRKRPSHALPKQNSNQKYWAQLAISLGALLMVLGLGDRFASSAAGCYGAVTTPQETTPPSDSVPATTPDTTRQPTRTLRVRIPESPRDRESEEPDSRKREKRLNPENRGGENQL